LFRRSGAPVRFSEGFHPKPHMASPLSLALGIEGCDEVLEVELTEPMSDDELRRRLEAQADPGLGIGEITRHPLRDQARAVAVEYLCPLVGEPAEPVRKRAAELLACATAVVERRHPEKPTKTVDLRPFLLGIEVRDAAVWFRLAVSPAGSARPEEVLELLHLRSLLDAGAVVARTRVELAPPNLEPNECASPIPLQTPEGRTA
jgi:radical SAM-linked protein